MKQVKRILSMMLVLVLTFALGMPVLADGKCSVTVEGTKKGQTYTLYKLFDAEAVTDADGNEMAITYTLPEGTTELGAGIEWFKIDDHGHVLAKEGVVENWAKDPEAITWAKGFGTQVGTPIKATSDDDGNVKWENLTYGYYFVDSTLGSFISVTSANHEAHVVEKNTIPSITKKIVRVDGADITGGTVEKIVQVGSQIKYEITIVAGEGGKGYVLTDTLPGGLTAPAASTIVVKAGDADLSNTSNISKTVEEPAADGTTKIRVSFTDAYLDTITESTTIVISYLATVNEDAVIGAEGMDNTATLTYGSAEEAGINSISGNATIYTAQISVNKKGKPNATDPDDTAQPLAGAGFVLENADKHYYCWNDTEKKVTWVENIEQATEYMSDENGDVSPFRGLRDGTYTLVEKTIPVGYHEPQSEQVTISDGVYTDENLMQTKTIINTAGTKLPSTGGIGTTIFYVVGSILVLGAGVALVVRKRMDDQES